MQTPPLSKTMDRQCKPSDAGLSAPRLNIIWGLMAWSAVIMGTGCTGPIQDKVGTNFRSTWIASRAKLQTPYADYPNTEAGRNEFIDDFVAVKNIQFHNYVAAIRRGTSYGQLGADSSRLVLDGLAATTGGAAVKAGLAAASAGITGFTGSFQKDVLFDQALPTFIEKMEELRANKLADITIKKKLLISEYTLSEAYNDVEDYGSDGTFDAALRDIDAKTGQATSAAKTALATAKGDDVSAAANSNGAVPTSLLNPPRQPDQITKDQMTVLQNQMAALKKNTPAITDFVHELRAFDRSVAPEKKAAAYTQIVKDAGLSGKVDPTPDAINTYFQDTATLQEMDDLKTALATQIKAIKK